MTSMNLRTTNEILDATEHLPGGATLVVHEFSWDDYQRLLEELAGRHHLRVSYDGGRLEIVSPSPRHEKYARFIDHLVRAFAEARNLTLENLGQTTWKRRDVAKGAEPDGCYYVQNAERIIGKDEFDLESDPPPDIVLEIDIASQSLEKFRIYAALAVPEIWRYDGLNLQTYELANGEYVETSGSRFLPGLTGPVVAEFIEISKTQGQTEALRAFRRRIQNNS